MSNEKLVLLPLPDASFVSEFKSMLYGFQMAPVDGPKSSVYENFDLSALLSNMSLELQRREKSKIISSAQKMDSNVRAKSTIYFNVSILNLYGFWTGMPLTTCIEGTNDDFSSSLWCEL